MARFGTILKSFCAGGNPTSKMRSTWSYNSRMLFSNSAFQYPPRLSCVNILNNKRDCRYLWNIDNTQITVPPLTCPAEIRQYRTNIIRVLPTSLQNSRMTKYILYSRSSLFPLCINVTNRAYFGGKRDNLPEAEVSTAAISGDSPIKSSDVGVSEWADNLKLAYQSATDAAIYAGKKVKEASDEIIPHVQQLIDSHPYLRNVIIPVGWTLSATALAWLVMPRLLRKLHLYSMQSPVSLLSGSLPQEQVPYERSFWGALEDPVRYLITFMAFSQLAVMIAPTTLASQYISQAWRGAVILAFVWFLHRWKTNVFTRALASKTVAGLDRERLLSLDKLSSVGLLVLGVMATAEACGVAVQSILTVGGIGGVATAFAARDILGNVLSGLSMQFSQPFSMGDTIKAGSIEGQVVEVGLTTTSLLNSEKFPVIVPNSLFSSQVIVNKSRAQWRAIVAKIPMRIDDLEKIPQISEGIKSMLKSNPKVFLGKEAPYCFLSRIENSYAELSIGCNFKQMSKDELYSTEQDVLLQAARIIKQHGAELGTAHQDMSL